MLFAPYSSRVIQVLCRVPYDSRRSNSYKHFQDQIIHPRKFQKELRRTRSSDAGGESAAPEFRNGTATPLTNGLLSHRKALLIWRMTRENRQPHSLWENHTAS